MISRTNSTNFQSGHIKNYSIPKGVTERTKPLAMQAQAFALQDTYQSITRGGFEHKGNNFKYEEGNLGACFHQQRSATGLELALNRDTGDMVTYKAHNLETNEPASISLIRGDKEITINDDEVGFKSYFNLVRAAIQDLADGGKK